MKKFIVFIILLGAFLLVLYYVSKIKPAVEEDPFDAFGCVKVAGYVYDTDIKACVRPAEVNKTEYRNAARVAAKLLNNPRGLTITSIEKYDCEKCFVVRLKRGLDRVAVYVNDNLVDKVLLENP